MKDIEQNFVIRCIGKSWRMVGFRLTQLPHLTQIRKYSISICSQTEVANDVVSGMIVEDVDLDRVVREL